MLLGSGRHIPEGRSWWNGDGWVSSLLFGAGPLGLLSWLSLGITFFWNTIWVGDLGAGGIWLGLGYSGMKIRDTRYKIQRHGRYDGFDGSWTEGHGLFGWTPKFDDPER